MIRKKQANSKNQNGAVLNRDFPSRDRSRVGYRKPHMLSSVSKEAFAEEKKRPSMA